MAKGPHLQLISGVGKKGPACFLLEAGGKRLLLDLGEGPPPGLMPDVEGLGGVDAVILSHGHRDHVGGLSLLPKLGNPPVYATEIVARGLPDGIETRELPAAGESDVLGIAIATGRNGHAPGGVWLHFSLGGDKLETLAACGPLLLPAPANGRGPELALALMRHGITDIHVDGATQKALWRLGDIDTVSLHDGLGGEIEQLAATVKPIESARGVMIAGSADGTSGETAKLLAAWEGQAEPAILFTGYVNPTTPADRLIKSGRAQAMRWNVHPLLSDTIALVRAIKAQTVIPAFCDRAQLPALAAALTPVRVTMDREVEIRG
jgi:Cft2 family RNA processing exonuclease